MAVAAKTIVEYYWTIPVNLKELAKAFEKAKNRDDLEYISNRLKEEAKLIDQALKFGE